MAGSCGSAARRGGEKKSVLPFTDFPSGGAGTFDRDALLGGVFERESPGADFGSLGEFVGRDFAVDVGEFQRVAVGSGINLDRDFERWRDEIQCGRESGFADGTGDECSETFRDGARLKDGVEEDVWRRSFERVPLFADVLVAEFFLRERRSGFSQSKHFNVRIFGRGGAKDHRGERTTVFGKDAGRGEALFECDDRDAVFGCERVAVGVSDARLGADRWRGGEVGNLYGGEARTGKYNQR